MFIYCLQLKLPPGQSILPVPHVGFVKAFHNINLSLDSLSYLCIPTTLLRLGACCCGVEGKARPVASGSRQCIGNYYFALNIAGHTELEHRQAGERITEMKRWRNPMGLTVGTLKQSKIDRDCSFLCPCHPIQGLGITTLPSAAFPLRIKQTNIFGSLRSHSCSGICL